jgi:hypothetical protein
MANQISVFLDPAQLPSRSMPDQATFDTAMASFMTNLPTFGAQFNAGVANVNASLNGAGIGIPYTVDLSSTADADPGNGKLRFGSATQNTATVLRLDLLGSNSADYTATLDTFDASTNSVKGRIGLVKQGDAKTFLTFDVTARATATGYRNITVTPAASSAANPFVNGDAVLLYFQRTGDKGDAGSVTPVLWVRDEKASGQAGGNAAAGAYVTRTLNTVKKNSIPSGASLASNQITLPAGTYRIGASAPACQVGAHQMYLYNVTAGATQIVGTSESGNSSVNVGTRSFIVNSEFTIAAANVFEIRHFTNTNTALTGLGPAANSGQGEVFTEVFIEKVS